ncbi:hypothetical protein ACFQ3J_22030 [Paenibacillus provencensis]|uniref:Uncharacterized protein n=1 Tax=Paenibacillus provencensis TaxID=441151 RepID=A0ABW3Q2A1_9BACL|nr:hypothetical protein [Paenibacillus sp. MER 78]MCM3129776.1 hypothetical protein [Paenibacillus sp. MER 78]
MMSKGLSAWFAISSMLLLMATAVALSYSLWYALLFAVLSVANIGWGFVIKAKKRRA